LEVVGDLTVWLGDFTRPETRGPIAALVESEIGRKLSCAIAKCSSYALMS
jgi:hypothetical protein